MLEDGNGSQVSCKIMLAMWVYANYSFLWEVFSDVISMILLAVNTGIEFKNGGKRS